MNRTNVTFDGKSLDATELESGDIEITGYAVAYAGLDADGENFLRGSLRDAIPHFLTEAGAPLVYHHQPSKGVLGKVLEMVEDSYGVRIRARINRQERNSPLFHLYDAIRRNKTFGLSLGGYFSRANGMISKVLRITELSVTPTAQHPLTLAHAEVKALNVDDFMSELDARLETAAIRRLDRRARAVEIKLRHAEILSRHR